MLNLYRLFPSLSIGFGNIFLERNKKAAGVWQGHGMAARGGGLHVMDGT